MATISMDTRKKQTIFVIDDDLDMLEINELILKHHGYEVFCAQNAEDAFAMLEKIPPPNLILLDYNLKDMNGLEFLKNFEKKFPKLFRKIPVVFLTSKLEVPKSAAIGLIQKTSDINTFVSRVGYYMKSDQPNLLDLA